MTTEKLQKTKRVIKNVFKREKCFLFLNHELLQNRTLPDAVSTGRIILSENGSKSTPVGSLIALTQPTHSTAHGRRRPAALVTKAAVR